MNTTKKNKETNNKTYKNTFSSTEYNSNNGLNTNVWGPCAWLFLHTISFNYPVNPTNEDKTNYRNFILGLRKILPCGSCRKNLSKNFKKLPLTCDDMKNRETFSRYVYELHEVVNKMLNKKSGLTYNDVRDRFENFRARCLVSKIKSEHGCEEPYSGIKPKCILKIVPFDIKCKTLSISKKCILKKTLKNSK
jgi:hypothetical protein